VEDLFVGSLIPRKRLSVLLDAIERVADPRLVLRLVGDPERDPAHARDLARRVAGSPALRDRVIAAGVADEGSLARHLAEADALVLPSSLEGYGMVVTEALHAGLPALVSREARAAADLGHPAVLAFDGAPELAGLLERLLDDDQRARLARLARDLPLPRWADTVRAFRAALVAAVAGRRS
jgi:glycosyltransferase involved in cell wall biosynthesis